VGGKPTFVDQNASPLQLRLNAGGASMSVEVRAALDVDLDALIQLNRVVQSLHVALYPGDFTPVVEPPAVSAFFAAQLASPTSVIGIAQADRVPVGYVWFEVQARPETPFTPPRSRIYVHHIAVAPEARRRGIATALMRSTSLARRDSPCSTWCCARSSPESAKGRLRSSGIYRVGRLPAGSNVRVSCPRSL
jgi:ribosomal protein S18 acetylase RimI-like enzyme